jgi:hypothetical protein
MKLLRTLERILTRGPSDEIRVDLKEISCKRKDEDYIKRMRTAAVGCEHSNPDGSDRQDAVAKLKVGQKVRLIWDAGSTGNKNVVYLVRSGKGQELSPADCFGRLNDKVGAAVINWLVQNNIVTAAKVVKLTGGTRKRPKLGCVLELSTYPGPKPKK